MVPECQNGLLSVDDEACGITPQISLTKIFCPASFLTPIRIHPKFTCSKADLVESIPETTSIQPYVLQNPLSARNSPCDPLITLPPKSASQNTWTNVGTTQPPPHHPNVIIKKLQVQNHTCTSSSLRLQLPNDSSLSDDLAVAPVNDGPASQPKRKPPCIATTHSILSESPLLSASTTPHPTKNPLSLQESTFQLKSTSTAQSPQPHRARPSFTYPKPVTNNSHPKSNDTTWIQRIPFPAFPLHSSSLFEPMHTSRHDCRALAGKRSILQRTGGAVQDLPPPPRKRYADLLTIQSLSKWPRSNGRYTQDERIVPNFPELTSLDAYPKLEL
ncbi:hypothetical protein Salat_2050700 [Sesamum alatum]|uniref:Uncharacterized protein n=1 Tax=Sesamum alatum TaxID=300844 RepID=A0AAE1Y0I5_9LAMI|nr:hypothetical protein Salat_2050700 [Sesamum alatum]